MKEGVGHREFPPREESLMAVEGDKLLLEAVYCTAQVICFDHPSAGTQVHASNLPEHVVGKPEAGLGAASRDRRGRM
eukprot:5712233-Pleurochrysis_carterae.AAC.1